MSPAKTFVKNIRSMLAITKFKILACVGGADGLGPGIYGVASQVRKPSPSGASGCTSYVLPEGGTRGSTVMQR